MAEVLERLKQAEKLQDSVAAWRSEDDAGRRVLKKRAADSLRAALLGRKASGIEDIDIFNPDEAASLIMDEIGNLAGSDPIAKNQAADYLRIVANYVFNSALKANDAANESVLAARGALYAAQRLGSHPVAEYQEAQFKRLHDAGADFKDEQAPDVSAVDAELAAIDADQNELVKQTQAWVDQESSEVRKARADVNAMILAARRGEATEEEAAAFIKAYNERAGSIIKRAHTSMKPKEDEFRARREAAKAKAASMGAGIRQKLLDASPVPHEEATQWAKSQNVTKSAETALKKIGYAPDKLRADLAEFYRMSNGRLPAVTIKASRGRASAEGIHGHGSSIINMGANFSKRTLFHELGHHLEADPAVLAAARGFLARRRESDRVYTLRDLTGNKGYGPREVAYKDKWFSPYVGKVYKDATEVFSMGLESFCDEYTLAKRKAEDPEMFAMIAGFMKTPPDRLFGAVKKVLKAAADAEAEADDERAEERATGLTALAAGVEFVKLDPAPQVPYRLMYEKAVYLGTYQGIDLYQCKSLRDMKTGRKKAGYLLAKKTVGEGESRGTWFDDRAVFGGMEEVKAMAKVWAETGRYQRIDDPNTLKQLTKAYGS